MQARFLLGPAGSGKTFRCLAEIRAELLRSPEGPPLLLLAPKQATFQLERQLLADDSLPGYTRLQILSFERLAGFILDQLGVARPELLSEEGRVMVLRALLLRHQSALKVFRASARLTGFAQQLSLLLRELQRHHLSPPKLQQLAASRDTSPTLRDKLHDLALILDAYAAWLGEHKVQDATQLLDLATDALRGNFQLSTFNFQLSLSALWLDGFAEMTPQELALLAALIPRCERATLAFCLEREPASEPSWLSTWSVVGQTFLRCRDGLAAIPGIEIETITLKRSDTQTRFSSSPKLAALEAHWSATVPVAARPHASSDSIPPTPHAVGPAATGTVALRLVECPSASAEAAFVAREILRHVRTGGRYRDCAVIVRSLEPHHATLAREFRRYAIPFFMDRRESVSHHPLAELTRFALRLPAFGWRHEDWFGALKTGLVRASEGELDRLENLALERGWAGSLWQQPLPHTHSAALNESLERLRQSIVPPFAKFCERVAAAPNGAQLADACRELWFALDAEKILERWDDEAAQHLASDNSHAAPHSSVLEQMTGWLDNLALAFPAENFSARDWLPILEAGLAGLSVGVVPPVLDSVLIGAIDRSRNPDLKIAFLLGLNEGDFPAPTARSLILTDADRAGLELQNVRLGPTLFQRLGHERYLGYIACTRASERLVLTRATHNDAGEALNPSPSLDHVKRITGASTETFQMPDDWLEGEQLCEIEAPLLRQPELAATLAIPAIEDFVARGREIQAALTISPLPPPTIEALFGRELKTSVSALEDFAACPFRFFAARALRLQERKEFQFDDRDKGSFHHEVLDEFHRRVRASGRQWRDLAPQAAAELVTAIAREMLPDFAGGKFTADAAARFAGEWLIERLQRLVQTLITWMAQYEFDPVACEIAFDDEHGELPSWRIELPGSDQRALVLRGRIDRVDVLRRANVPPLAVVMDYKSRVRELDPVKLHHGLELQLLSYLGVLKHLRLPKDILDATALTPAGVFYVPLNGGAAKSGSGRSEILVNDPQSQRAAYRHSGRFLADELTHFDHRGEAKGDQFRFAFKKDGTLAQRGNDALPAAEFEALREQVEAHLREHARRIFAGEISASPFRINKTTACDYCDFRPVCRFDPWTQPFRALRSPAKENKE
ncbi:MAG: hypothetical protein EPO07_03750 [Verrucomicrobia bacterium]|nr:MAG: hypothetical protein EPO07_03750 [Verrucomicrobiota bacterium]